MEERLMRTLLFDFYGELLTEHQRTVYQSVYFDDMSLSEVAADQGISRQGVHDLIKRCTGILQGYEDKLHLVEKFEANRKHMEDIHRLSLEYRKSRDEKLLDEIERISGEMSLL